MRVLIADDEVLLRDGLARLLEDAVATPAPCFGWWTHGARR